MSKLDSLPKESRPFTASDLAERLVGAVHAERVRIAREVKAAFQAARNRNHAAEMGRARTPTSKIAAGLAARAAKAPEDPKPAIGREMRGG